MGAITIDNVFRSVILATLKSSNNSSLRTTYNQILIDLDNDKDLTCRTSYLTGKRVIIIVSVTGDRAGKVFLGGHEEGCD